MGFYIIFLVLIIFICSLLNLIGVNSTITNFLLFLFNICLFFIYGFKTGIKAKEKGYIAGIKIALCMLLFLILINIFMVRSFLQVSTILYYLILVLIGTFGGMYGKSKKKEED